MHLPPTGDSPAWRRAAAGSLDHFARLVCRALDVPTATVTFVEPDRQCFPGAVGLAEQWARDVPGLDFHPVVSDAARADGLRTGLVHEAVLADWPDLSGHDLYMSGPPAMIDAALPRFLAAGLPEDRLYYDSFEYAPDVLAQIIAGRAGIHDG